ncbi:MAG: hypothetical protein O3B41_07595, partial [Bacteroidetes bacterium]|nr:hypothetical protein [Bacteroidota bacterium]
HPLTSYLNQKPLLLNAPKFGEAYKSIRVTARHDSQKGQKKQVDPEVTKIFHKQTEMIRL